jgi:hypothetical protein
MNFLRQFRPDPFRGCDLFDARLSQAVHGAEFPQEQILPVLAHARAIVENAFADAFFHEQLVVGVREPVGLVANSLEQSQRAGVRRKHQRQRPARPINLLVFLGEANDRQLMQPEALQLAAGGRQLSLAAIDDDQVWQANGRNRISDTGNRKVLEA